MNLDAALVAHSIQLCHIPGAFEKNCSRPSDPSRGCRHPSVFELMVKVLSSASTGRQRGRSGASCLHAKQVPSSTSYSAAKSDEGP